MADVRVNRHAIDRALERYGLCLTGSDLAAIQRKIKTRDAVRKGGDKRHATWFVSYAGKILLVCVDEREEIKTILPPTRKSLFKEHYRKPSRQSTRGRRPDSADDWHTEVFQDG